MLVGTLKKDPNNDINHEINNPVDENLKPNN